MMNSASHPPSTPYPSEPDSRWYESAFGEWYPVLYPHRDCESAEAEIEGLFTELGILQTARTWQVLDACCGAGRHLAAMRARGCNAWGFDLSGPLLASAARTAATSGRIVRADIRAIPFATERFDAVFNLFSSFGYFHEEVENRRGLAELARLVRPGGILVLDHMNPSRVSTGLVPRDEREVAGHRVVQRRWIEGNRVRKIIDIHPTEEAAARGSGVARFQEDVRLYAPEELREAMRDVGVEPEGMWGDFCGATLGPQSPRMILCGRKRAGEAK